MVVRSVALSDCLHCVYVCSAATFDIIDLDSLFLIRRYTFTVFRLSSLIKVSGSQFLQPVADID